MFPEIAREKRTALGSDKTRVPSGLLRIPVSPDQKPLVQVLEKSSVVSSGRGVARGTVDGRHCQWPWEGFKADGNGLYGIGLEAEEFVVS